MKGERRRERGRDAIQFQRYSSLKHGTFTKGNSSSNGAKAIYSQRQVLTIRVFSLIANVYTKKLFLAHCFRTPFTHLPASITDAKVFLCCLFFIVESSSHFKPKVQVGMYVCVCACAWAAISFSCDMMEIGELFQVISFGIGCPISQRYHTFSAHRVNWNYSAFCVFN